VCILHNYLANIFVNNYSVFRAIGVFNETDTLESSSILIYYFQELSIYTQQDGAKPFLIKKGDKEEGQLVWHVIKLSQGI